MAPDLHRGVVLAANTSQYVHAARALDQAGHLKRFVTGIALTGAAARLAERLPPHLRETIAPRVFGDLPRGRVTSCWTPELSHRALTRLGRLDQSRRFHLQNTLFDKRAARALKGARVYHHLNGLGTISGRKAERRGAAIICDQRATHPLHEIEEVGEEARAAGVAWRHPEAAFLDDVLAEHERADLIITNSSYARKTFLARGHAADKIVSIPLGFDPAQYWPDAARRDASRFTALFVGTIIPRKGIQHIVDAWRSFADAKSRLIVVGADHHGLARTLLDQPGITYLPSTTRAHLRELYQSADVTLLPSVCESWGLVVVEAMACGSPVVVSSNVGAAEAVEHGRSGLVVPPRAPDAIAGALHRLRDAPERTREMGRAATSAASAYTWDAYAKRLRETYDSRVSSLR